MAKVIKNFDFPASRRVRYPWDKWLDGQVWELNHGEDFLVDPAQMRRNVYSAVWARGLAVQTHRKGKKLIVQAFHKKAGKAKPDKDAA